VECIEEQTPEKVIDLKSSGTWHWYDNIAISDEG